MKCAADKKVSAEVEAQQVIIGGNPEEAGQVAPDGHLI